MKLILARPLLLLLFCSQSFGEDGIIVKNGTVCFEKTVARIEFCIQNHRSDDVSILTSPISFRHLQDGQPATTSPTISTSPNTRRKLTIALEVAIYEPPSKPKRINVEISGNDGFVLLSYDNISSGDSKEVVLKAAISRFADSKDKKCSIRLVELDPSSPSYRVLSEVQLTNKKN